jgi:hypothetical protein
LTLEQLAARVAPGRDPSQREQNIASQNLKATPYSINNFLEYGNGQGVAGGAPTTVGLYAGHNYTLVDNKTGEVLAQGSTPEEIQRIQEIANNLSATQGKNADWRLYDATPEAGITNMHEKMPGAYLDLSTPGDPRGVVVAGNMPNNVFKDFIVPALTPIALAAGAYFGGGALLGQLGGGGAAATGGLSAAGGATGGAAASGGLTAATGAGLSAAASGVAPIVVTGGAVTGGLTAAQTAALAAGLAGAGTAAGSGTGAGAGGSASAANPYDPIVVTGGGTTTGLEALPAVAAGITPTLPAITPPLSDPALMQPDVLPDDIVVDAPQTVTPEVPFEAVLPTLPAITLPLSDPALMQPDVLPDDIVVNAPETVVPEPVFPVTPILPELGIPQVPTPDPALTNPKKKLGLEEYLRIAGLFSGLIGGGGKSGQAGTYIPGGRGLNSIFSAKLPSASSFGVNRTLRPMGDVDWLTYATRPELNFYDYAARSNPAPITRPIPNNPAGPIMYAPDVDNMRFAQGGAAHVGQPPRTQFAVNGAGTGRSDDIPAVLSDGEYVIDAETVALLGDGSNKAGAKKLDELRVKVRKHKGQKLAKGRFSANAKKPEAYLSGGRV